MKKIFKIYFYSLKGSVSHFDKYTYLLCQELDDNLDTPLTFAC